MGSNLIKTLFLQLFASGRCCLSFV